MSTNPLYQSLLQDLLQIAADPRRTEARNDAGMSAWREQVRERMARQIIEQAALGGDLIDSTLGYVAACEGFAFDATTSTERYAALCAEDTAERAGKLCNPGRTVEAECADELLQALDELDEPEEASSPQPQPKESGGQRPQPVGLQALIQRRRQSRS